MSDVITRRGLEKALNDLEAEFYIINQGREAIPYESVYCFIDAYSLIRREHPDATDAADLARKITRVGG